MDHENLKTASKDVKDLLKKLLEINPVKRYSAIEALEHPWLK